MDRINKAALDRLPMYATDKIVRMLQNYEKEVPEKEKDDDETYRKRLIEVRACFTLYSYCAYFH